MRQIYARRRAWRQRNYVVQPQLGRIRGRSKIRSIPLRVIVNQRLRGILTLAFVKRLRVNWQHVARDFGAERHLIRAHFALIIQCDRAQRTALTRKSDEAARRGRGVQWHAEQREKFVAIALRDLIAAIEQCLGQKRGDLYNGDARITLVRISLLSIVDGNARGRFVQQILIAATI